MPLEKHCVSRGCLAVPMRGFGSALRGTIRFACPRHLELLQFQTGFGDGTSATAPIGGGWVAPSTRPSPPTVAQGRLL